jgi:hypothetical protein
LRGSTAFADLRRQTVEGLRPAFDLKTIFDQKTIKVGFAFQLSFKSGPQKERAGAGEFAELRAGLSALPSTMWTISAIANPARRLM